MRYTFFCVRYYVLSLLFACVFSQEKFKLDIAVEQNALDATLDKDLSKAGTTEKSIPVKTVSSTISSVIKATTLTPAKENVPDKPPRLVCPGKEVSRPFFSLPCAATQDCGFLGRGMVCCNRRCIKGVPPPKPEPKHSPTFFGFVERICPVNPLAEIWEIKECKTDSDCSPRICCPETLRSGENVSYCRTAQALWDKIPAARQIVEPINNLVSYMQCTPPPPPLLDIFPKACQNPLDCFPNLCCQEGGKKYCRPPRRSLFALIAGVGQRLVPAHAARRFIERITS
ncbi:uncharacterized protein LOC108910713 [Anoplophora glabripennis]|uniref:uncharacterized protein LOC108910713 n=1 Tax=Anoplophora glabripennis TaxID=217634 RepID=UPI000873ECD4|nr:uncharacterized protein LOC108910713 [Anoplophora glabripennis]